MDSTSSSTGLDDPGSTSPSRRIPWAYLGEVPYGRTLAFQRVLAARLTARREESGSLLLLTHPPTFTVGLRESGHFVHRSKEALNSLGFDVQETDRGGLVTYHGPGQLVGYPVLHLGRLGLTKVSDFVLKLEKVMIGLCRQEGIDAAWEPGFPGVWVGRDKIGAIGLHIRDGISTHGFAFNVNPDLSHYRFITACGLSDRGITSLRKLERFPTVEDLVPRVAALFGEAFGLDMVRVDMTMEDVDAERVEFGV